MHVHIMHDNVNRLHRSFIVDCVYVHFSRWRLHGVGRFIARKTKKITFVVTYHKSNVKTFMLLSQTNEKRKRFFYVNIFHAVFLFLRANSCSKRVTHFIAEIVSLFFLFHHFHSIRTSQVFGICFIV